MPGVLSSQALIPLRVALGDVKVNKIPFIIYMERGIYQKIGLDKDLPVKKGGQVRAPRGF